MCEHTHHFKFRGGERFIDCRLALFTWTIFPTVAPPLVNLLTIERRLSDALVDVVVHAAEPLHQLVSGACLRLGSFQSEIVMKIKIMVLVSSHF